MTVTDVLVSVTQAVNLADVQHEWTRVGGDVGHRHHLTGQGRLVGRKQGSATETSTQDYTWICIILYLSRVPSG